MKQVFRSSLIALAACVVGGCGGIDVQRVTPDNEWTLHGFRYYLARPYVAVKRPFPLKGTEVVVSGKVTKLPDGSLAVSEFGDAVLTPEMRTAVRDEILRAVEQATDPRLRLANGTGGDAKGSTTKSTKDEGGTGKGEKADDAGATPTTPTKQAGAPSDPVLPLNDLFDVVLLPDFDQQYAINVKPSGGGKTETSLQFRNGWMLESVNSTVDNTAVTNAVKETIGKLIDAATSFIPKPPTPKTPGGDATGDGKTTDPNKMLGSGGVEVKVRVLVYPEAQPGLYPLLKPSEWRKPMKKDGKKYVIDATAAATSVCDDARPIDKAFAGTQIPVALPCPPYTVVAFNYVQRTTVTVIAVNAVPPAAGANDH